MGDDLKNLPSIIPAEYYSPPEFYEKELEKLNRGLVREGNKLDKLVLIFSSGALVLSASTVLGLVEKNSLQDTGLLWWAWLALILSLLATFLGYLFIKIAFQMRAKRLTDWKNSGYEGPYSGHTRWALVAEVSNYLSVALVFIGISLLMLFAFNNISAMSENKNQDRIEKSASENAGQYGGQTAQPPKEPQQDTK